jgi:shikimate dehydrogenase
VERPGPAEIVVNATSVGLHDGELPLDALGAPRLALDLVYRAGGRTQFEDWGTRAGARVVDGLEILVRQGALSFRRWTGQEPPVDVMRRAARGEMSPHA